MKKVMASLSVVLAVVLGAAFVSVGLGVPAHADCEWTFPGSVMWQKCMSDPGVHIADAGSKKPVCQQPWPGGVNKPCSDCTSAISNPDADLSAQISFDCGQGGGANKYGGKAHCAIVGVPTMQPDCFGNLQADGSVIATN
jgi:hypothetical protein